MNEDLKSVLEAIEKITQNAALSSGILSNNMLSTALETNNVISETLLSQSSTLNSILNETKKLVTNSKDAESTQKIQTLASNASTAQNSNPAIITPTQSNNASQIKTSPSLDLSGINDVSLKLSSIETILKDNVFESPIIEVSKENTSILKSMDKILQNQLTVLKDLFSFYKATDAERKEDYAREQAFSSKEKKEKTSGGKKTGGRDPDLAPKESDSFWSTLLGSLFTTGGLGILGLIGKGILVGIVGQFAIGFINKLFDGMLEGIDITDIAKSVSAFSVISNIFKALKDFAEKIEKPQKTLRAAILAASLAFNKIFIAADDLLKAIRSSSVVKTISSGLSVIGSVFSKIGSFISPIAKSAGSLIKVISNLSGFTKLLKLVGKIFKPLGAILSIFEGVSAGIAKEGNLFQKIGAGIGKAIGSFFGSLLDLGKQIISWGAGKLGLDGVKDFLDGFSFVDMISSAIEGVFDWINLLFADPKEALNQLLQGALGGFKSILDIVFFPINEAVQWISRIFGWEDGEDFSLTDLIWGAVESAWTWVSGLFSDPIGTLKTMWANIAGEDGLFGKFKEWGNGVLEWLKGFLPDMDKLQAYLLDIMPDWMRSLVGAPERTAGEIVAEKAATTREEIEAEKVKVSRSEAGEKVYTRSGSDKAEENERNRARQRIVDLERELSEYETVPAEVALKRQEIKDLEAAKTYGAAQAEENSSISGVTVQFDSSKIDAEISRLQKEISEISSYQKGTPGFLDFGKGTLAALHGEEAVVPRNTDAGNFLSSGMFSENWKVKEFRPRDVTTARSNNLFDGSKESSLKQSSMQMQLMNMLPQINAGRTTSNISNTTIVNNISPHRSLDEPSLLK
jgi:hypothetical protein